MATDIKISQMPSAGKLSGTEIIPIVQDGVNRSSTVNKIREGLVTNNKLEEQINTLNSSLGELQKEQ